MIEYIQFPRYSIFLIPSKSFFIDLNLFYKNNNLNFENLSQSIYGIHFTVKAPFYLSHIYSENDLIKKFNSLKKNKLQKIFKESYEVKGFGKFNNNLILELDSDKEFNFLINDLMRTFDLYRKTLDNDEIEKDLRRFDNLSEKELMYYQIWGYPYYFECSKHHISLTNFDTAIKYNQFQPIKYDALKLLKQEKAYEKFIDLSIL